MEKDSENIMRSIFQDCGGCMMNREILCKAKCENWRELPKEKWWVEGYLMDENYINMPFNDNDACGRFDEPIKIDPKTICRCTGKNYINYEIAYEGDIFQSQVSGDFMILKYGTYQAYCPIDEDYMDSVGFYAECKGYPDMPIGDLKDYALKSGNIFDNPELLEECQASIDINNCDERMGKKEINNLSETEFINFIVCKICDYVKKNNYPITDIAKIQILDKLLIQLKEWEKEL